jgi:hypothetical protein
MPAIAAPEVPRRRRGCGGVVELETLVDLVVGRGGDVELETLVDAGEAAAATSSSTRPRIRRVPLGRDARRRRHRRHDPPISRDDGRVQRAQSRLEIWCRLLA